MEMTIGGMILGVIFGGLINWLCSKHYYGKATKDLNKEAGELRRLNILMLEGMELAGWVTLTRDAQRNPISYTLKINVHDAFQTVDTTSPVLIQTVKGEEGKERR
jgi:hypothetical protein